MNAKTDSSDCHDVNIAQDVSRFCRVISVPQHEKQEMLPELVDDDDDDYLVRCDACPYCRDVCANPSCIACKRKIEGVMEKEWKLMKAVSAPPFGLLVPMNNLHDVPDGFFTMCQVRRHNHSASAWLLCGDEIYDATKYIRAHPGGEKSIIRKSGGVADCARDLSFHSYRARKIWKRSQIGTLRRCPGQQGISTESHDKSEQCVIS